MNTTVSHSDRQKVVDAIFNQKKDYSDILRFEALANPLRQETKERLKKGFNPEMFYVPKSHPLRLHTLFYDFSFGYESKLASTGVYEHYFQSIFEHHHFKKVINYIFPEMIKKEPWNFQDKSILKEFRKGLFDFNIPGYKEAVPIRLATYFYPNNFLPIFKLDELKQNCEAFGFEGDAKSKGEKLFIFNSFLSDNMKDLPFINVIKQNISYQVRFTIELLNIINNSGNFEATIAGNKTWVRNFYEEAKATLVELKMIG